MTMSMNHYSIKMETAPNELQIVVPVWSLLVRICWGWGLGQRNETSASAFFHDFKQLSSFSHVLVALLLTTCIISMENSSKSSKWTNSLYLTLVNTRHVQYPINAHRQLVFQSLPDSAWNTKLVRSNKACSFKSANVLVNP